MRRCLRAVLGRKDGVPGFVASIQTLGSAANAHPHVHALVRVGLGTRQEWHTSARQKVPWLRRTVRRWTRAGSTVLAPRAPCPGGSVLTSRAVAVLVSAQGTRRNARTLQEERGRDPKIDRAQVGSRPRLSGDGTAAEVRHVSATWAGSAQRVNDAIRCKVMYRGAMATRDRALRQSVTLPGPLARRVRGLAKARRTSASHVLRELIESGLESREKERRHFLDLADRLARSEDPAEQERVTAELARLTFGE